MQYTPSETHESSPLYGTWGAMKSRCYIPSHRSYKNYGGRGISMCNEWRNNFREFEMFALTNGWRKGLQFDRIDNDGNYEPGNVRFVTARENVRKRRVTKITPELIEKIFDLYNNHSFTHDRITEELGLSGGTVSRVLAKKNWGDTHNLVKNASVNNRAQKLTVEDVRSILKSHYIDGVPKKRLARQYGMAPNNIRYILSGKFWNHIWREFNYVMMFLKPTPTADYMT